MPIEKFMVLDPDGVSVPIINLSGLDISKHGKSTDDVDSAEYLVRVKWIKKVSVADAIHERGLFGVQHTVARPKNKKWLHTIERLRTFFGIAD